MPNSGSSPGPTVSAEQLWQFSLALYPQVKSLCLKWQDELGANVNLLLLLCYLEQQQLSLTSTALPQLAATLNDFNTQFTQPLRALRQSSATAPLSAEQQQTLKQTLLQAELELEKLEQQLLVQQCPPLNAKATPLLELYLAQLNADIDALAAQIFDLRQACKRLSQHSG
uniref:TIGR02444 family protein n=1 Tax=Rheinheimera sp. BAL341 TaxID=1708203 RepID=A0A486XPP0_9GAMM